MNGKQFFWQRFHLFIVVSCLSFTPRLRGAEAYYYQPPMPDDLSEVDMYLLTTGVGNEVANRFGHTGLRLYDKKADTDVVFNWGEFSFDAPFFLWRFFRGELTYGMGVSTYARHVAHAEAEKRRLWQDRLNLTASQKRALIEKLIWNAAPEHRKFSYQYWYKNCATIPRDYLSDILGGAIREKYQAMILPVRYRDYVRGNLRAVPFVVPTLDVVMNQNIDKPISAWQDMFLPVKLREHLLSMPAVDDAGRLTSQALLVDSEVLAPFVEAYEAPFNDYLVMVAPMLILFSAGFFLSRARSRPRWRRWAFRSFGLGFICYGALAGVYGVVLTLNWLFSGHPDTWSNANLLLFWPLDLLYGPVGWRLIRQAKALPDRLVLPNGVIFLASAHLMALLGLVALAGSGVIRQDVWPVVRWFGAVVGLGNLLLVGFCSKRHAAPSVTPTRKAAKR